MDPASKSLVIFAAGRECSVDGIVPPFRMTFVAHRSSHQISAATELLVG